MKLVRADNLYELAKMPDKSVSAIITDPPYDLTRDQMEDHLEKFRRLSSGVVIIFAPPENQWPESDQYLFWTKPISTKNTSRRYSRFVEIIHVYGNGTWNADSHWSNYTNIFQDRIEGKLEHPFQKPLSLMMRLVMNHTNRGDIVLDPFMGIGTTLVAAQQLGRDGIGIEIDLGFFEIAKRRIEGGIDEPWT